MSKCKKCDIKLTEETKCDCGCGCCKEHCENKSHESECCNCQEKDCCK